MEKISRVEFTESKVKKMCFLMVVVKAHEMMKRLKMCRNTKHFIIQQQKPNSRAFSFSHKNNT